MQILYLYLLLHSETLFWFRDNQSLFLQSYSLQLCPDPDHIGRNWRYWSPSTDFFLFCALLYHCNITLYWSNELPLAEKQHKQS
jgi:hypothetical protein